MDDATQAAVARTQVRRHAVRQLLDPENRDHVWRAIERYAAARQRLGTLLDRGGDPFERGAAEVAAREAKAGVRQLLGLGAEHDP
jgi:hypothetical protein